MEHFTVDTELYQRDIDFTGTYKLDSTWYLHRMSGRPMVECMEYVESVMTGNSIFDTQDPRTLTLTKNKVGDREISEITFREYIQTAVMGEKILSPTLVTYENPGVNRSVLAEFTVENINERRAIKKEMFKANRDGDTALEKFKDKEQVAVKTSNNSLSGAYASPYTPVYLKSAHSTLTSTCRAATSYGNASNEKFLCGNRHYWDYPVVIANIIRIVSDTDYDRLNAMMTKFGIRNPTVDETMECIVYSTSLYLDHATELLKIRELVSKLTPPERSAFVYTGDMYHLAKYNDGVVRTFLDKLSTRVQDSKITVEETDAALKVLNDDQTALVSLLCAMHLNGGTVSEVKEKSTVDYLVIGATAVNVISVLDSYYDLIQTLWVTKHVPPSIASIPVSIRRGAITSDTDSTIFTVQDWVTWYSGHCGFDEKSMGIWYTTVYVACSLIVDILARMSANMGVERSELFRLKMKNEYSFPVFSLTSRAKHYYAYMSAREGNVFPKMKLEVKGVGLKDSNLPPEIMTSAHLMITDAMDTILRGEKLKINEILTKLADMERAIKESVMSGGYKYLASGQVKTPDSYKNPQSSPYIHYELWQEVFADKYGQSGEPNYATVKVSIEGKSKSQIATWIASMEDRDIATKMEAFLKRKGKTSIASLQLPEVNCGIHGVPPEVILAIDVRKLIHSTMNPFYIILESMGIMMNNDRHTRLVSDTH